MENPRLGRYSAARRVARSIYIGSAPIAHAANRGLDDRAVNLACVQPGESVATFSDALRRLTDRTTFLYDYRRRYWYSTQPSVNRVAQDRAVAIREDEVFEEIARRLRRVEARHPGDFSRVHVVPMSTGDVPDEREARLVILGPEHPHSSQHSDSPAREYVQQILDSRGNSPRRYKNTLVFVVPDRTRLLELDRAVRSFLAWQSTHEEREQLNLDAFQRRQAETKTEEAESTIQHRIPETYQWLIVPDQPNDEHGRPGQIIWDEIRITASERLAVKASRRLKNDEQLFAELGPTRLRIELDRIPLWRGDHVEVRQLCEDFAQYLYLPRLKSDELLIGAIRDGAGRKMWHEETFAYAEGYDENAGRYLGLVAGQANAPVSPSGLVVKPDVVLEQKQREAPPVDPPLVDPPPVEPGGGTEPRPGGVDPPPPPPEPQIRRFHGSVEVGALRVNRDVNQIAQEVIQHLEGLPSSKVRITLEIEADLPDGAPDHTVRTVSENARVLNFKSFGFEEE